MTGNNYVNIYITEDLRLTHTTDNTQCIHGLPIPHRQWTTTPYPLQCRDKQTVHQTPKIYDFFPITKTPSEPEPMNLKCPCGKPATWILIYGCEKYNHIWEDHLCKNCCYKKVSLSTTQTIRNHIYTAMEPWTCLNIINDIPPNIKQRIECEITRWYARELTPDMYQNIIDEKLENLRNQTQPWTYH